MLSEGMEEQRYGFLGSWGYQEEAGLSYLHVGFRWYNPSTGRFLQRDPIGAVGGLNPYVYADNDPVHQLDPDGLHKKKWQQQKRLKNGRFGKKKWRYRKMGPSKYVWVYGLTCTVVQGGYWVAGKEYPGHPHELAAETVYYYGLALWKAMENHANDVRFGKHPPRRPAFQSPPFVCLAEGTEVLTEFGPKRIEELEPGMMVNGNSMTSISSMWVNDVLTIDTDACRLRVTAGHPFLVRGRWIRADQLQKGDLLSGEFRSAVTGEPEAICHPIRVYNIVLSGNHQYRIGEEGILTHNKLP